MYKTGKQPYWVYQNMEKLQLFWALQKLQQTGIFSLCQASKSYWQSTMQLLKCRERLHTTWMWEFLSLSVKKANLGLTLSLNSSIKVSQWSQRNWTSWGLYYKNITGRIGSTIQPAVVQAAFYGSTSYLTRRWQPRKLSWGRCWRNTCTRRKCFGSVKLFCFKFYN